MAVYDLAPWVPDLAEPRMAPCQATGIGTGAICCGATPASLWRRWCFNGHEREVRLCGVHAKMITAGMARCDDCARRGVICAATLAPVDLLLLGHATAPRGRSVITRG
jgi:hypothetical protein